MQLVRCTVCNQPNHEECAIYEQDEYMCPNCKFETIHNQNEDETLLKVMTSQETVELKLHQYRQYRKTIIRFKYMYSRIRKEKKGE